jgi:hypothetical protein
VFLVPTVIDADRNDLPQLGVNHTVDYVPHFFNTLHHSQKSENMCQHGNQLEITAFSENLG